MNDITTLEQSYSNFTSTSRDIGNKIASSVSMLQLNGTNQSVAEAVIQIEALTNKKESGGVLRNLPMVGKYFKRAEMSMNEQTLKTGKVVDVVDRLFNSLSSKKDNIMEVMETLFNLKEQLSVEVTTMVGHEAEAKAITVSSYASAFEKAKARNLLVQVSQSIIKCKDRVGIIDTTCKSAEATTMAISSLLPALHGELVTEMAIQGGLQELKEFKIIFDSTMEIVNSLNKENSASMVSVLEDVIDLAVTRPTDLALLTENATNRIKTQERLQKKMEAAKLGQEADIIKISELRSEQKVLSFNGNS